MAWSPYGRLTSWCSRYSSALNQVMKLLASQQQAKLYVWWYVGCMICCWYGPHSGISRFEVSDVPSCKEQYHNAQISCLALFLCASWKDFRHDVSGIHLCWWNHMLIKSASERVFHKEMRNVTSLVSRPFSFDDIKMHIVIHCICFEEC